MTTNQQEGMRTLETGLADSRGRDDHLRGRVTVSAHPKGSFGPSVSIPSSGIGAERLRCKSLAGRCCRTRSSPGSSRAGRGGSSRAKLHGATFVAEDPRVIATFAEVLDERPTFEVIALDAPIGSGVGERCGARTCDREARLLLGRTEPPVRRDRDHSRAGGAIDEVIDRLDGTTPELALRNREIAAEMAPYRQRTVYEVLPELTFFQLNGDTPIALSKRSTEGLGVRRSLLEARIPGVERILDVVIAGIAPTLLLDAAACLWSAAQDRGAFGDTDPVRAGVGRGRVEGRDRPVGVDATTRGRGRLVEEGRPRVVVGCRTAASAIGLRFAAGHTPAASGENRGVREGLGR